MAAVSIPMVMLIAPAAGGCVGSVVDRHFGIAPVGLLAGLALGVGAAAARIRSILRGVSEDAGK